MINAATTQVACAHQVCPNKKDGKQKMEILCLYDDVGYLTGNYVYDTGNGCKDSKDCSTYKRSTCERATGLCERPEEPEGMFESAMQ
ncbi:hypothetical protein Y032_0050g2032 [Ancylostoma ceylanicum]|uniref:SCP domain-containing protein n=1 Tax=Ancylostoma ceylanicum TaxID=53326 RepID=A0A016U9Q2_9BILA|nr:hypothetical protein Y032_0050g2032 [Ancylostoma ceylanicum]